MLGGRAGNGDAESAEDDKYRVECDVVGGDSEAAAVQGSGHDRHDRENQEVP